MFRDFVAAIRAGARPRAHGRASLPALAAIEKAYYHRTPLIRPWVKTDGLEPVRECLPAAARARSSLSGRRILVTGGSGFIGGRVVEKLRFDHDSEVRVMTRYPGRAARVARLGVDLVEGEIGDREAVGRAVEGVDLVVHCGRPDSPEEAAWRRAIDGAAGLVDAVREHGAGRIVNVGTMAVYGEPDIEVLDETAPVDPGVSGYARWKAEGDAIFAEASRKAGVDCVTLQPTIVYGPFGGYWTRSQFVAAQRGPTAFPSDVSGKCNAVYVDDVADAILLALVAEGVAGERFLISAERPVSWRTFHGAFEAAVGRTGPVPVRVPMPVAAIERLRDARERPPGLIARLIERMRGRVPDIDLILPDAEGIRRFGYRPRVSIDKAKTRLGYQPRFDFEAGMSPTVQWAGENGLLTSTSRRRGGKTKGRRGRRARNR